MQILQLAIRLNKLPSEIENEDAYWVARLIEYFAAETEAEKLK